MSNAIEVKVPDIGDFKGIPVIEVLVKPGDTVGKEDALVTLESDKATMEVPSPVAGRVKELKVKVGDKVSEGSLILILDGEGDAPAKAGAAPQAQKSEAPRAPAAPAPAKAPATAAPVASAPLVRGDLHADVVVLGSGPGGYTAAFRAADLGKQVVLIERYPVLGGVCLNVGCIPSKALLHAARVIAEADEMGHFGVVFGKPKIEVDKLRDWKGSVVEKSIRGLSGLAKQRKVTVVTGTGAFTSPRMIEVRTAEGVRKVSFDHAIIAAGSQSARIPGFPYDDERLLDSTSALQLKDIPKRLLVIGGGIIGLEMACVYDGLGSKVTVVELMDSLIPGADRDLVRPLAKRIEKRYEGIHLKTRVTKLEPQKDGLKATFEGENAPAPQVYDRVLLAVGRRPNGKAIGAEAAGVNVNERGWIPVDKQQRTNVPHIFAIGDIVGEPMLAHKASYEGKIAAEVIAGHKSAFDARTVPSVAYTDPEIAWMGLTEAQAKAQGVEIEKASFPWAASGRARAMAREDGLTKLILEKGSGRVLGAGIVGPNAGELIAEAVLALEMGADAQDLALTIHAHPTLSETTMFAAEIAEGSITDLYMPKK
ncbi:MAG TPA: dihydrolipoyl dehydrogenase [Burkholderiales bacterium]|jgi:dihydrolipoamide dehydrogenase|nr:dihydrolipoyl dehydrogenase [Burkholderiales bacterium]